MVFSALPPHTPYTHFVREKQLCLACRLAFVTAFLHLCVVCQMYNILYIRCSIIYIYIWYHIWYIHFVLCLLGLKGTLGWYSDDRLLTGDLGRAAHPPQLVAEGILKGGQFHLSKSVTSVRNHQFNLKLIYRLFQDHIWNSCLSNKLRQQKLKTPRLGCLNPQSLSPSSPRAPRPPAAIEAPDFM